MKTTLGNTAPLPVPVALIGADVDGKPNYCTVCCVSVMEHLHYLCVGSQRSQHTNKGIRENKTFSVNIPSVDYVVETDHCGLVSGHDVDKSDIFRSFYGKLKTAPMIEEFPVCMECRVTRILDDVFEDHELIVGELVETYCEESCLTEGKVDMSKAKFLLYAHELWNGRSYWTTGDFVARAWDVGKQLEGKRARRP